MRTVTHNELRVAGDVEFELIFTVVAIREKPCDEEIVSYWRGKLS